MDRLPLAFLIGTGMREPGERTSGVVGREEALALAVAESTVRLGRGRGCEGVEVGVGLRDIVAEVVDG